MSSRWLSSAAALMLAGSLALLMAASAGAATVRVAVTGSMMVTESGGPTIGIGLSGVEGDLVYPGIGTSTGTVTLTMPSAPPFPGATGPGASLTEFHGNVSQGCVRLLGNRAIVIGRLPASEQFDISFGHMEWVGTHIEDNGVATGTPVDRARGIFFRTTSGFAFCDPSNPNVWTNIGAALALDAGDASFGYADKLDGFPANPDTDATVTDPNGLSVSITDAADPDGLSVAVGPGSGKAKLSACGNVVNVNAGSTVILTCASLIVEVVTGSAEVVLGGGLAVVSIPEGGKAEIADDGDGGYIVENLGPVAITITVDGVEGTIEPGETDTLQAWDFQGFFQPVDAMPTLNKVRAGAAVPLTWRLLDSEGAPVTDLAGATITISALDCDSAEGSDEVEQTSSLGSGLQNLGDGYYQLNWKTSKELAGTCKTLHLDIGDGATHDAYFDFRK